jgi:O-antigen/teichoic acid export membrane protein
LLLGGALFSLPMAHVLRLTEFGWRHARWSTIHALLRPALAFMGFPIGNALNLQGTVLAVSYALGPTSVVIFGTARTVSRVALQMVQMVNSTFEPEITRAFGAGNMSLLRTLHRRSCQLALLVSLGLVAAMRTVGFWFGSRRLTVPRPTPPSKPRSRSCDSASPRPRWLPRSPTHSLGMGAYAFEQSYAPSGTSSKCT